LKPSKPNALGMLGYFRAKGSRLRAALNPTYRYVYYSILISKWLCVIASKIYYTSSQYLPIVVFLTILWLTTATAEANNLDARKQNPPQSAPTAPTLILNRNLAQSEQQAVALDLSVNLIVKGQITAILRGGDFLLQVKDLATVGISTNNIGKQETIDGEIYVSLLSLAPDITYKFDDSLLKLEITSNTNRLTDVNVRDLYSRNVLPPDTVFSRDSSAYVNYALNYNRIQGSDNFSAFSELGYSFDSSLVSTTISSDAKGSITRGFSSLTIDNSTSLDRWTIGDNFANFGELGGNLTVGGVSLSRQFSLNPYFVSTPQDSSIKGAIASPSTVEVYNNGILVRREQLNPGQFELRNVERDSGSNNTTVIIRDAFGREQIIKTPFYFSSAILKPGVSDYHINVGFKRTSIEKSTYELPGLRASYRWGVNSSLTAGARLEATNDLISGGGEIAWKIPTIGEFGAGAAISQEKDLGGWAGYLRYNYTERQYSFGGSLKLFSDNYSHSSLSSIDDRNLFDASIQASVKLSDTVGISGRYSRLKSRNLGTGDSIGIDAGITLSANSNLTLSATRSIQPGNQNNNSIFAGLSINLGDSVRGNLGWQQQSTNPPQIVAQVEKSVGVAEDFGYRINSTYVDSDAKINANLRYQNSIGLYELNYNRAKGLDNTGINIAGGAIFIGGKTVLSRPLSNSSYGLIQVPGLAGVGVSVNSVNVGRTNANGDLVVSNLQPYYANSIGVNLSDVPFEYRIDPASQTIAPPAKAGAIITFTPQKIQNMVGKVAIKFKGKTIIPTYGNLIVTVGKKTFASPLSEQGEFYLENVPAGKHPATVEYGEKECKFNIQIDKVNLPTIELGNLNCLVNY
jgi:outer membrane usher protein